MLLKAKIWGNPYPFEWLTIIRDLNSLEGFMKIFISVISHLHQDVIINLESLKRLARLNNVFIVCLDNIANAKMHLYCNKYGIHYLANSKLQGFSANNNIVFEYCQKKLDMQDDDIFMLLNPDVMIDELAVQILVDNVQLNPQHIHTPNLFLDKEHLVHDDNIRKYPNFWNFVKTYLFNDRTTMINRFKEAIPPGNQIWASGAAMAMKVNLYQELGGLDEGYYMYCEDIDFCMRAAKQGIHVIYHHDAKAVHFRQRDSKHFLTRYFFWHVQSVFLLTFTRYKLRQAKSRLKKQ